MKNFLVPVMLFTTLLNTNLLAEDISTPGIKPAESITQTINFNDTTTYYVNSNSIRVRSTPDLKGRILGEISLNDRVQVINPTQIYNNKFIEIKIVKTYDKLETSERYFISIEALSEKIVDYKDFTSKYFIVVNVATETIRLYERQCLDNSCPHKMIMESEVVVGEDVDHPKDEPGKGRTILGSYRVIGTTKFYQDPAGHYPAWYRDGYPAIPKVNASWNEWFSKKVMPADLEGKKHGAMRGAFGWYAIFNGPEAYGQWTHGTLGWGADKDTYIKKVKKPLLNIISDPRSSGCTRNNNEAIAYLRSMVDVGTPVIKIYAKEELSDSALSRYNQKTENWDYVMTKNKNHAVEKNKVLELLKVSESDLMTYWAAVQQGGETILDPSSTLNQVIEVGTYEKDTYPSIIPYTPGEKLGKIERKIGRKGNVYGVKSSSMSGTFYVDTGMLSGYNHPAETLEVGGFDGEITPPWMNLTNLH